jgi:hypothetical protein
MIHTKCFAQCPALSRKALDTDSWETSVLMGLVPGEVRALSPGPLALPDISLPSGDPLSSCSDGDEIAKKYEAVFSVLSRLCNAPT